MTPLRFLAIAAIYCCTAVGWFTLGGTVVQRTGEADGALAQEVARLWGGRHVQIAPAGTLYRTRTEVSETTEEDAAGRKVKRRTTNTVTDSAPLPLDSSRVQVALNLDQRRKGLLWYNTYGVTFGAHYRMTNPDGVPRAVAVQFAFPSAEAIYDGFSVRVNGVTASVAADLTQGSTANVDVPAHGAVEIEVAYRSRGLGNWTYAFSRAGVEQVRDFELTMTTDFRAIDFPAGTMSPTRREELPGGGYALAWRFDSLVTGQRIGMEPPSRLNPGPMAARITFFAPVSLLFFVTVLLILGALRGCSLHPMNYFFLSAAFFAFHLLLAYLVDHVDINAAFLIASATSVFLVVSYLRVVAGTRMALGTAGTAQLVFLVLFSYSFFFEGYTGLAVTIGAVATLFVLMQMTARVDWGRVFGATAAGGRPTAR